MLKELAYVLIKVVIIPGYNPSEDIVDSGIGALSAPVIIFLKKQSESINATLRSRFSVEQVKTIKIILAESDDRLIPTSPASIYEYEADVLQIARIIFNSYKARQENVLERNSLDVAKQPFLGNEDNNEQIIQGIAVIIKPAISLALQSPEYLQILTKEIGNAEKAIENNTQHLRSHDDKIDWLEERVSEIQSDSNSKDDISSFYTDILNEFTEKKEGRSVDLIGSESDEESYIDAYIEVNGKSQPVLPYLREWFNKNTHGTMLIYGEPGHGKSLLCKKAVVEYIRGNFLRGQTNNVLAVSLNIGENPGIISNGAVSFENMLAWGPIREHKFSFEDCRGSLLFMDGFDEFIDAAVKADLPDIISFMRRVGRIAKAYDMHIVVLSREIAIKTEIKKKDNKWIADISYKLLPLTIAQQNEWLDKHMISDEYREIYKNLQSDKNMQELVGVPLLFRMIVHTQFDKVSSSEVELYDALFKHLMNKRDISGKALRSVEEGLINLAYKIYCTGTDMADLDDKEWNEQWVFAFYVKAIRDTKVGFFHQSFYQYFLAKYIIAGLIILSEEAVETYIGSFAERELDDTVLEYLSQLINQDNEKEIHTNLGNVINTLVRTQAIINFLPEKVAEKGDHTKLGRATNIYRNVMHIAYALKYVIRIPFSDGLATLIRTFRSAHMRIYSDEYFKADLHNAYLVGAYLIVSQFKGANMSGVNLFTSNLMGADLTEANLDEANMANSLLQSANLTGASLRGVMLTESNMRKSNLRYTRIREADLRFTVLREADLMFSDLTGASLIEADLRDAFLDRADLSRAVLIRAKLPGASLCGTRLIRTDLTGSYLRGASLEEAFLNGANLCKTDMRGAILRIANLKDVNLSGADLSEADLRGADLSGADLSGANLTGTKLTNANLCVKKLIGTKLDRKYLSLFDKKTEGYDTVQWV